MPILKIWGLPKSSEFELRKLHKNSVKAIIDIEELGLKDGNDITVLFPPDMMTYGLGVDIIAEVSCLFEKPERTLEVRRRLAESVGKAIKQLYPSAKVECFVYTFDPIIQGFWSSKK